MIEELVLPDGTRYVKEKKERYTGWRLKYGYNPDGMPAVTPAQIQASNGSWNHYIAPVKMTQPIQSLAWSTLKYFNPQADADRYSQLYHYGIAITNGNGFGDSSDPRANYITGENLNFEPPKLMDGIIMSGQLYQGVVEGKYLAMYPNVHAMSPSNPVSLNQLITNKWYYYAVSWHEAGFGEHFFPKFGGVFTIPYIISEKATYDISRFEWWDRDYPPDPLKVNG